MILECGAIIARNPQNLGAPIIEIDGMNRKNPRWGSESKPNYLWAWWFQKPWKEKRHHRENNPHELLWSEYVFTGCEVSTRVSKGIPIPACPVDSRENRDTQISMSSSVQPSRKILARASSSWPTSVSIWVITSLWTYTCDITEDRLTEYRHYYAHTLYG